MTRTAGQHGRPMAAARRRRGVVMIIVLLGIILLTSLVLFVLNIGDQVNRRVSAQNAADATAAAGATWVARSLNTVARNNVTMTRCIALVNVLDSLPQAVSYTRHEQTAMRDALQAQLRRGVSNQGPRRLNRELRAALEEFLDELNGELEQIEPVDEMLEGVDVARITHYRGGSGRLWRAMVALDEMNQTVMREMPTLAQDVAVDGGAMSLRDERGASAFVLPVEPRVPWRRGEFDDFRDPVRYGTLPDDVDDPRTNRGPYDAVFGWHDPIPEERAWEAGSSDTAEAGSGSVPVGSDSIDQGRWVDGPIVAYHTWGTHGHLLRRVNWFVWDHMRNARLNRWVRRLANAKRDYLWPSDDDANAAAPTAPAIGALDTVVEPNWVIDWARALEIAASAPERIKETAFIAVEIKSRYPRGDARFLEPGTWAWVTDDWPRPRLRQPHIVRVRGWEDPRQWTSDPEVAVEKVVDHGWRDTWNGPSPSYTVWFDHEIGIGPAVDGRGRPIPQPVWRIDHFYFAGVNVGEHEDVANPYEGFDPASDDAPAPIDFDHERMNASAASRRAHLTFLGVVRQPDRAQAWPSRFRGGKPLPAQVALAQAGVFNNHSWDLWTQMWHAQLEPIRDYQRWIARMERGSRALGRTDRIDPESYAQLLEYLRSTRTLGELMTAH